MKKRIYLSSLAATLMVFMLCGCGFDDDNLCIDEATTPTTQTGDAYLTVTLQVGDVASTRATDDPYGGEDGNGRELGTDNENAASDVTILLYADNGGINSSSSSTTIAYAYYFDYLTKTSSDSDDLVTYVSATKKLTGTDIPDDAEYHVIAIVNGGDLTSTFVGQTLTYVRDYIITQAWTAATSISDYTDFVMTSESDATLTISSSDTSTGTQDNPYTSEITVERLAARIDIIPNVTANSSGTYTYEVKNSSNSTETIGYFVLSAVVPFNCLNSGEYLIKRVTTDDDISTISYLGEETATDNAATNYVIDPWTLTSGSKSSDKETAGATYGDIRYTSTLSDYASDYPVQSVTAGEYYVLAYTQENTFVSYDSSSDPAYTTSVAFIGTYYETSEWDASADTPVAGASGTEKTYTYLIRHSDPNDNAADTDIMKYGIVRNNIYRITVDGVEGTVKTQGINITLHVVPWAQYTHTTLTM